MVLNGRFGLWVGFPGAARLFGAFVGYTIGSLTTAFVVGKITTTGKAVRYHGRMEEESGGTWTPLVVWICSGR